MTCRLVLALGLAVGLTLAASLVPSRASDGGPTDVVYIDSYNGAVTTLSGVQLVEDASEWDGAAGLSATRAGDRFLVTDEGGPHWQYTGVLEVYDIVDHRCTRRLLWYGRSVESTWAPDGHRFAVTWAPPTTSHPEQGSPTERGLVVVDLATDPPSFRSLGVTRPVDLTWHPTNGLIAYTSGHDAGDVAVINSDGGGSRILIGGPDEEHEPSWSPDGRRIAFVRDDDARGARLFIADADGSDQRHLRITIPGRATTTVLPLVALEDPGTYDFNKPRDLAWTADGTRLLVAVAGEKAEEGIWSVDVADGSALRLTQGFDVAPAPLQPVHAPCAQPRPAWAGEGA